MFTSTLKVSSHNKLKVTNSVSMYEHHNKIVMLDLTHEESPMYINFLLLHAGSASGQDEDVLTTWDCPLCSHNLGVIFWPYNKPFVDQAYLVKMAGDWPCSCFVLTF